MRAIRPNKTPWILFALFAMLLCLALEKLGIVFFINHTASMPQGIYIKTHSSKLNIGDIVVFNTPSFKGNLIKYILAISESEFCFDEEGTLWVEKISQAQININKYSFPPIEQSVCESLKSDEILVIGDHPDSYDSRYFGAIKQNALITKVTLLFPFESTKE